MTRKRGFPRIRRLGAATAVAAALTLALGPSMASADPPGPEPEVRLQANVSPGLNLATRVADEDVSNTITVQFSLQLRNRAQLDDLIRRVSTPGSPRYGKYLKPAEFRSQFGPTAAEVDKAVAFLQSSSLTVTSAAPGSTLIDARGTVAAVQQALHTSIGRYREANGREFFANDGPPALPASLASTVVGVVGLDNRHQRHRSALQPRVCPPTCGSVPYTPTQIRTAYQLTTAPLAALTGSGQTLGLFELDDFNQANIDAYNTSYSLPAMTPQKLVYAPGPTSVITNGGELEVELDIELMHAIAPGAQILVFEGPNTPQNDAATNATYKCMVDPTNTACPNHSSGLIAASNSTSWGICESAQGPTETGILAAIFAQAAAQGQSFFAASGDSGAHDCSSQTAVNSVLDVDSPASDPNITGAGGTNLRLNTDSSINQEVAWNNPAGWSGSGGGKSTIYSRPAWQVGPGVDTSQGAKRQVPDISLDADPATGYSVYSCSLGAPAPCTGTGAGWQTLGGTSAAAPAWAAFTAVYNQYAASQAKPVLGFANPTLYQLGACPQPFQPFNDITSGNNKGNLATGYSAGPNYDMVTGLGTLRAADLVRDTVGPSTPIVKVNSLSQSAGVTGNTIHVLGCGFATSGGQPPSVTFGSRPASSVTYVSSTDLSVVVPFNFNGTVAVTVTNPPGAGASSGTLANAFTYNQPPQPPPPAGGTDLFGVLLDATGSGQVEVHAVSQASHYSQFSVHAATAFGSPTGATADWQFFIASFHGDGQPDLYGVKLRNTGSHQVEVHVLSAASGYQSFALHAATALAAVPANQFEFAIGSFGGDRNSNLYAIMLNGTGSNTVEVHVLSEASSYNAWMMHSASAIGSTTPTAWQFRIGDRNGSGDLVGILHTATGSGRTEVHILSRASSYQGFTLHIATPLGATSDSQFSYTLGDHDNDGIPDLYAVLMNGSGSGQTEVHIISGGSNYTAFNEHAATGLGPTSSSSPTWQYSAH